jgi:dienelactone hydrolase
MYQNYPESRLHLLLRSSLSSFFIFLFFSGIVLQANAQTMQTTQRSVYTRIDANVGGYLESLPNDYASNPTKKYPLIIFMHGVGERGNGTAGLLEKVANVGIPKLLKNSLFPATFTSGGKSYSFIVLSPQFELQSGWTTDISAIIAYAKKTYRVDEQKVYLTGLSLGGYWGWAYTAGSVATGEQLAASLIICPGAGYSTAQLDNLRVSQVPIWVTNNSGDPVNTAANATALVNAVNTVVAAPNKALLTIFNKTGHDAWTPTYDPNFRQNGLSVYEWMLSKTRGTQTNPGTPVLTANAGADQILTLPTNTVTLDASGSKVTSGTITSYSWAKVSGPTTGILTLLSNGLQAKLTELVSGTYVYQLTVKDSNGSTATDNVTITVNTASTTSTDPPTVNAGLGQTITLPTNSVTLDGSLSKASAGNTIVSYKWAKSTTSPAGGTITTSTSVKTTVTGLVAGTYVFNLTVTDSRGSSKTGGTQIIVNNSTVTSTDPPTANAGKGQTITLPINAVNLDGSLSTASAGNTIVSYKWAKSATSPAGGTITTPTSVKTAVTGLIAGTYIFNLTVTDSRGSSKTGGTQIIVNGSATSTNPPTAKVASSLINLTLPADSAVLDGSSSVAAAGNTIVSYKWTKYTGPTYNGIATPNNAKITVTGLVAGSYGFTLTVTDNNGKTSSINVSVIVSATSTTPPTANVAASLINLTLPANSAVLDGSPSVAAGSNTIVSYKWSKYTGPTYNGISTPNNAKITVTGLVAGNYGFTLTVADNNGKTSSTNVSVIVKAAASTRTASAATEEDVALSNGRTLDVTAFEATIAPNPVQSTLNIRVNGSTTGKTSILVYTAAGQLQLQQEFTKDAGSVSKQVNISRLPVGIYIVHIVIDDKHKKVLRFVKQ